MCDLTSKPVVMPADCGASQTKWGDFLLVNCVQAYNNAPIYEYRSQQTGFTVFIAEVEGPIVNGYICLATETFDDDGLPHTLEHLVFLGSENYPFKGILDLLANRCLASGTNAWTDVDHTCYTMETAGPDGFLVLMPIYLEHILYPTLADHCFLTEVHHVTGDGNDAGVVYCEMQGRENSAESRLFLEMARALYPGRCGYSSETGGIMKNLRESTTNEKVRDYHRKFYRPENVKLIITGQVKHEDVFRALEPMEQMILSKGERGPFQRPWQSPVPQLESSHELSILYPCDDESNGLYAITWRGPNSVTDQYRLTALTIFLKYLTEFSTYTLPKAFVEIDDPYASDVSQSTVENSVSHFYLLFEDVPLKKMAKIKPKLEELLRKIADEEDILMDRIQNIIKRTRLEHFSNMENCPASAFSYMLIGYILYGNDRKDLEERIDPISTLNSLEKESKSFWVSLLRTYFIDNKYVSIECRPSKKEYTQMAKSEKARIKEQITKFGVDGLDKCSQELSDAVTLNSRPVPDDILASVPIPSLNSVHFHHIERFSTSGASNSVAQTTSGERIDFTQCPLHTCFDHIKSEFTYIYVLIDSSHLTSEQRVYLPLYIESLFESPLKWANGDFVPYETVVDRLNDDTVSYGAGIGVSGSSGNFKCGVYAETLTLFVQAEAQKFAKALQWLRDILFHTHQTAERLRIIAQKINNSVAQTKRQGKHIAKYAMKRLRFVDDCNYNQNGVLVQQKFLTEILAYDADQFENKVVSMCNKVQTIFTNLDNVALHLFGHRDKIQAYCDIQQTLTQFLPDSVTSSARRTLKVTPDYEMIREPSRSPNGCLIGMACLESSFFIQTTNTLRDYNSPELPALMLYLQYLIQTEGPMWRQIRGLGYSYGYHMSVEPQEGLLYLSFSKATNVVGAYEESRTIIQKQLHEKQWDTNMLDSARSSLIFQLIDEEKTIAGVVGLSLLSYFQGVDYQHNRNLLRLINEVSLEDLNRVGDKYLTALFDPTQIKTAIVAAPEKLDELVTAFKRFNMEFVVYPSVEESFPVE